MMSQIRSLTLILFLFIYSCGTNVNSNYSIIISKKSQFSKNGDKISLKIKNPSDKKIHIETNDAQISLSLEQESLIKKEISSLDLYNTSPVEVIKKLEEIKKNHCL